MDWSSDTNAINSEGTSVPLSKRKKGAQKYEAEWEQIPEFKGWLTQSHKGETFAKCHYCNSDINISSGKDTLIRHGSSRLHLGKLKLLSDEPSDNASALASNDATLGDKIKEAEIKLRAFGAKHNFSPHAMDHLFKLCASMLPDSNIAQGLASVTTETREAIDDEEFKDM
ncbi:hypothetical protein NQ315_014967 [Exocentrus adspersus]|uniref:BED-type domain-containing protein n=1 Tax=Exocentrus adspersus TaxID=1586481 RepID=A0AAV8V7V9_9CUCU|nr:hypothetical protein NQ315_014967 [Exocentrus adspersus]